ncbi:hypothetical protein NE237_024674 [Protea cynaroides]|uniref:Uncharacterized protein n=1 Tax=Protea cynaroides TaxID=273540 RepID=A0A9Q0H3F5_9MAGN|nr:hypothetical protein NE237_024674 [Protea cynaroides]
MKSLLHSPSTDVFNADSSNFILPGFHNFHRASIAMIAVSLLLSLPSPLSPPPPLTCHPVILEVPVVAASNSKFSKRGSSLRLQQKTIILLCFSVYLLID